MLKHDEEVEGQRENDLRDQYTVDESCVCIHSNSLLAFTLTAFINEWGAIYCTFEDSVKLLTTAGM